MASGARRNLVFVALFVAGLVAAAALASTVPTYRGQGSTSTVSMPATTTTSASTTCVIMGQPGPLMLRVLSDAGYPLSGVAVSATNQPANCGDKPATSVTTVSFTTGTAEWYSLDGTNDGGYSLSLSYSGRTYTLDAALRPVSVTCATVYLPSDRSNVTMYEFQSSCP